jgi:hypothetical protein
MRALTFHVTAVLLALVLAACTAPPKSVHPLAPADGTKGDDRLLGAWYATGNDPDEIIVITIDKGEGSAEYAVFALIANGTKTGEPAAWVRGTAHASILDGAPYYNLRITENADDGPGTVAPPYIIMRAQAGSDGALSLQFMSERLVERLGEEGRIPARPVKGGYAGEEAEYMLLDMPPADLAAFIREETPERLFTLGFGPLRRLAPNAEGAEIKDSGGGAP